MTGLKKFLSDFPGHNGTVVTALLWINLTALIVCVRLALGAKFPEGYDTWLWILVTLAGVNAAGLGVKRLTDFRYKQAGTSPVNIEAPSNVKVETTNDPAKPILTKEIAQEAADVYAGEKFDPPGEGG